MRPEIKFYPTIKEVMFTLLFTWTKRSEVFFKDWSKKAAHSVKANQLCFDEIKPCADVSFHMISFRVVFTCYFITRNEISFLSK